MLDALGIGQATWDVSFLVARFPQEDRKTTACERVECVGGPAANAALLLARWGHAVGFAGVIGDDRNGETIAQDFSREGIDLTHLRRCPGQATPLSAILVSRDQGARTIINHAPSGLPELRLPRVPAARLLVADGHQTAAMRDAMEQCPAAISVLDAGSLRPGIEDLARRVDACIVSESYLTAVAGEALHDEAAIARALAHLAASCRGRVAATLGSRGYAYWDGREVVRCPALPARVVDTTGAGDIFHGAFCHGQLIGISFAASLALAARAAARSVEILGGSTSIPPCETMPTPVRAARIRPDAGHGR